MEDGMERLPEHDVKRDLAMRVYICHIYHVLFIWKECLPGLFIP